MGAEPGSSAVIAGGFFLPLIVVACSLVVPQLDPYITQALITTDAVS